jgi:hypothetical protein
VQLNQAAEDHTLVVGPDRLSVVRTVVCQSVVYRVILVDQPAVLEPRPLPLRPVAVERTVLRAVCQVSGKAEEQLVCNRADVDVLVIRIDSAVAAFRGPGVALPMD